MNNKNDLIARYIYAVTRHLPAKIRDDVEKAVTVSVKARLSK